MFVPNNCTDLLQPIDLSVNKAVKEHLRQHFRSWCSEQVQVKLQAGEELENITLDLRMSVMKELSGRWIVSACDHICSHPEIITNNSFKKAGIVEAIADPDTIPTSTHGDLPVADDSDEDPFEDHPEIITNGFKKAGIVEAIADPDTIPTSTHGDLPVADDSDEDPFEDCDL